jgi:GNAT superfamily N-acetyltransferase
MSGLSFNAAGPDQIDAVGDWLFETGPEIFDYIFDGKENALRHLAAHWALTEGVFSHSHAILAHQGGKVVALELGFTSAQKEAHTNATGARFYADLSPEAFEAQIGRAMAIDPLLPKIPDDAYYLQNLVVAPGARGSGTGRALLRHAFERAKDSGLASVHLDVLTNNPAVGFYLANGMDDVVEIHVPKLVRSHAMPGVIRMVKTF